MRVSIKHRGIRLERTAELVSRYKQAFWGRFLLRFSVVSVAIAVGALLFRNLDLIPDLSYLDVSVLSGAEEGQYYTIVQRLAASASAQEGMVNNLVSGGSRENLDRLQGASEACEIQFGLVQNGFDPAAFSGLELIGRVGRREAVMLLGKNGDRIRRLADLRGLRIGVGPERSGTAFLGERLFTTPDLADLGVTLVHLPYRQQMAAATAGEIDLALVVMDEEAKLIGTAIRQDQLQLVGLEHAAALAQRFAFVVYDIINAGHYDLVSVLPPEDKPILRLDTLLLSNGCADHSDVVALMTLLSEIYPDFIERNQSLAAPPGLTLSESARGFYVNGGAEFADEYVPWLVDIMPPSNWVYTIMAVSLFLNLAGFLNNHRLALIDINRVALENDIALLFGERVTNDEIRHFDPHQKGSTIDMRELDRLIAAYKRQLDRCRRQSLSVLSPIGEEMGYRDQEIMMNATLDALRELRQRLQPDAPAQ